MHIHIHINIHKHTHKHTHTHTHTHSYTYTYINTHIHTHIHTHTFLVLALGPKMSKATPDESTSASEPSITLSHFFQIHQSRPRSPVPQN